MGLLVNIFYLPVDLLRFTRDLWRIALDMFHYRFWLNYRDQPCIYCQSYDNGLSPRLLPMGIRKYRNRWLARALQPCIRRGRLRPKGKLRYLCVEEGGYVVYPGWIPVMACLLTAGWAMAIAGALYFLTGR